MKRNIIFKYISLLWVGLFCAFAQDISANTYNVGNYNIRVFFGDQDDVTSPKYWENRKEYVGKTVVDNNYDVIGFQEIWDDHQEQTLREVLPGYSMTVWGRDNADVSTGERLAVAYKTDKFDLLDHGHFFLTPDINVPGIAWDAGCARVSVWAKLQDKETKDIFFFLVTHLDNSGGIARREEARINSEQMQKISWGYPAIIVGDFNAIDTSKQVHYAFGRYYSDSRLTPNIPIEGPVGTLCAWDPNYNEDRRIDFIYTRLVDVKSYKTITEDYGRGISPSDHFPIIASITLQKPTLPVNIYVSAETGDDNNDGSIGAPIKTLYKALSKVQSCDTLRVAAGTYYTAPSETISRNSYLMVQNTVVIVGGYDSNFENIIGYSKLDGDFNKNDVFDATGKVISGNEDNSKLMLNLYKPYELTFKNFEFCNGYLEDPASNRAAVMYVTGYGLNLINSRFINNNSKALGGAIRAQNNMNLNNCTFKYNSGGKGGAFYLDAGIWTMSVKNCNFESNSAEYGSAIFLLKSGGAYFYGNSFVDNAATKNGAVTFLGDTDLKSTYTFVNNTFANNKLNFSGSDYTENVGGSALFFSTNDAAQLSMVNNTIVGNESRDANNSNKFRSAAVNVGTGGLSLYNNIIAGNYSTSGVGDIINDIADVNKYIGKYNLHTSADNISIKTNNTTILSDNYNNGILALAKTLDGSVDNSCFKANAVNNGGNTLTVKVTNPVFEKTAINALLKRDLNEYYMSLVDLDGGAGEFTVLAEDQRGIARNWDGKSTIGAYEYVDGSGDVESKISDKNEGKAFYCNGIITVYDFNSGNFNVYNVNGQKVKSGIAESSTIDVSDLMTGVYIFVINDGTKNYRCKFIR